MGGSTMASILESICCCLAPCCSGGGSMPVMRPPSVTFDERCKGKEVSISGRQQVASGTGVALATTSLQQDRAYFEYKVNKCGSFQVGVASKRCDLNGCLGDDTTLSWGFQ